MEYDDSVSERTIDNLRYKKEKEHRLMMEKLMEEKLKQQMLKANNKQEDMKKQKKEME